jgi:predicted nucleic acid-binding protein
MVMEEGRRLSARHTLEGRHRAFDILHVAAARVIGAATFLTFDGNQKRLAEAEGLVVSL